MGQIMFETDYPHADSTLPDSSAVAEKLIGEAGLDNARGEQVDADQRHRLLRLARFGITA